MFEDPDDVPGAAAPGKQPGKQGISSPLPESYGEVVLR